MIAKGKFARHILQTWKGRIFDHDWQRNGWELGNQVAAYAISHASSLGVKYVIYRQRIYDMRNPGWRSMEDRGGITANHFDHVHISVF